MRKSTTLLATLLLHACIFAQCLNAPAFPSFLGTEPLVTAGVNITSTETKYYYGAATSISNVKMSGGTLVVCGDLTLNDLVFDSGTVYIRPNVKLVINNPAGLIVRGNTKIYNSGTFQCLGNFVMEGTWASASKPNIFINVSSSSYFKMPNQYFVINNPHSWVVNNGIGDFHGIITDPLSATGSICLGFNSQTIMRVLYNKAKHPYVAPNGPACVMVEQFSQFYDTLTAYPTVNVCLGSSHTSDASCIPWGCKPNAWGAAQVTTGCSSCSSVLTFLTTTFRNVSAKSIGNYNEINWQVSSGTKGLFYVQRSENGSSFNTIDSVKADEQTSYYTKDYSSSTSSYYRIVLLKSGQKITSEIVEVKKPVLNGLPYPNPFRDVLIISISTPSSDAPLIKVTDAAGRTVNDLRFSFEKDRVIMSFGKLSSGVYVLNVTAGNSRNVYKIIKE